MRENLLTNSGGLILMKVDNGISIGVQIILHPKFGLHTSVSELALELKKTMRWSKISWQAICLLISVVVVEGIFADSSGISYSFRMFFY